MLASDINIDSTQAEHSAVETDHLVLLTAISFQHMVDQNQTVFDAYFLALLIQDKHTTVNMFGTKDSQGTVAHTETVSFDEDYSTASDKGFLSFFHFNMFEADDDDDDADSFKDDASFHTINPQLAVSDLPARSSSKRTFWKSRKTFRNPKRTGKVVDHSNGDDDANPYCDTRDDSERELTHVESMESFSRDDEEQRSSDTHRKCFPFWPLKKRRGHSGDPAEPMDTIQETESISTEFAVSTKSVMPYTHDKYHVPSSSSSPSRHRPSPRRAAAPLRTTGTYIKPSNYDDNIWDDQSASSGWFSLESLDAR